MCKICVDLKKILLCNCYECKSFKVIWSHLFTPGNQTLGLAVTGTRIFITENIETKYVFRCPGNQYKLEHWGLLCIKICTREFHTQGTKHR